MASLVDLSDNVIVAATGFYDHDHCIQMCGVKSCDMAQNSWCLEMLQELFRVGVCRPAPAEKFPPL